MGAEALDVGVEDGGVSLGVEGVALPRLFEGSEAEVVLVGEADADECEGQVVFLLRGMRVTWPQPRQVMATWGSLRWRMRVRLLAPGTRKALQLRQTLLRRSRGRWVRLRVPILRARSMYLWARWGSVGYVDSACLNRVRMRSSGILVLGGIGVGLFFGFWVVG